MELSIQEVRNRRREGVVQCGNFADKGRGFFRFRRPHFLVQKKFGLFEVYVFSQRAGWVSQCRHFKERVNFFLRFVRTSFMDTS